MLKDTLIIEKIFKVTYLFACLMTSQVDISAKIIAIKNIVLIGFIIDAPVENNLSQI